MTETISTDFPEATEEDYIEVQGGIPQVTKKGKLTVVTHDYTGGDGMIVSSHIDHGTVTIPTSTGPKEFKVDLLKRFHGDPCQTQSNKVGGASYPRKK